MKKKGGRETGEERERRTRDRGKIHVHALLHCSCTFLPPHVQKIWAAIDKCICPLCHQHVDIVVLVEPPAVYTCTLYIKCTYMYMYMYMSHIIITTLLYMHVHEYSIKTLRKKDRQI